MDGFILHALAAGIGVAVITGFLGCFVVLRRMAYFGDSLAHSALLGIALGMLFGIDVTVGMVAVGFLFATFLFILQRRRLLATDTLLGILSHGALSTGLVAISLVNTPQLDLYSYLFGDILTVRLSDLMWIYGGGVVVIALIVLNWPSLVLMTIHEDLARAEGVRTLYTNILFIFLMTLVVAVSIRIVGILLITSMLIIPAATARQFVTLPETMVAGACLSGCAAVLVGMAGSLAFDTPTGPSIVMAASAIFALAFAGSFVVSRFRD
ncbi:MAG: hypothetical protein EOM26_00170 [Alphaproteobacteria bacterium]|nr:hypothetical protein [Alphaproteobacteria bacterium]